MSQYPPAVQPGCTRGATGPHKGRGRVGVAKMLTLLNRGCSFRDRHRDCSFGDMKRGCSFRDLNRGYSFGHMNRDCSF